MTVEDLERLYDYGYWANKKLFHVVVSQLTPEQFTRTVAGSYGSIRNTLVHVLSAEWGWLDEKRSMVLGPLMQHAANHGVHHRGQVALLLRSLGFAPGNIDILFYDAEKRHVPAW